MFPFQNKEKKRAIEKICNLFTAIRTNWRSVGVYMQVYPPLEGGTCSLQNVYLEE